MKLYSLYREQILKIDIQTAWEFFSSPQNLKLITPPYLGFEITSNRTNEKMFAGMIIPYIVKPNFNIPFNWVTEITHDKEKEYFVDKQHYGPSKLWHHLHNFKIVNGKVLMIDLVNYAVPFGIIRRIAHKLFIRGKIEEIYDYRKNPLDKKFT